MARPEMSARVDDEAPTAPVITQYDEQHMITYLRLLDADGHNVNWRRVCRDILGRNPGRQSDLARRCWETHLARARWMSEHGYKLLLK